MDFKTKEFQRNQQVYIKIVADPTVEEAKWLPACSLLDKTELIRRSPQRSEHENPSPARKLVSFMTKTAHATVLSLGQIFMVAAAACACGSIASVLFGQSYERVMYHCGPQDTIVGVFILLAIPLFWIGWYLYKQKIAKLVLLLTICPALAFLLGTTLSGIPALLTGVVSFASLASFLYGGSYLASWKGSWPRKFKPTLWLSIFYISASIMLSYEFLDMDLTSTIEKVPPSTLFYAAGTIAVFALIPAFFTAITSGTRRFASAFGLAIIGQLPLLVSVGIYCLANAAMLACVGIAGPTTIADYFAKMVPPGWTPDFDLAPGNQSELVAKLVSSLVIWLSLFASLCAGSSIGVLWNRMRSRKLLQTNSSPN